jgi:hypothetical protein
VTREGTVSERTTIYGQDVAYEREHQVVETFERIAVALEGILTRLDAIAEGNKSLVTENFRMRLLREQENRAVMEEMRRERTVNRT